MKGVGVAKEGMPPVTGKVLGRLLKRAQQTSVGVLEAVPVLKLARIYVEIGWLLWRQWRLGWWQTIVMPG